MSELKAFNSERIYWAVEQVERVAGDIDTLHLDDSHFYLKSEADKAISELEESHKMEVEQLLIEIAKLQKQVRDYAQGLYVIQARAEKEARHNKYKRCLAMAGWCEATALWCYQAAHTLPTGFRATLFGKPVMIEPDRLFDRFERLTKWSNRWMNLAKKFKPNKE